MAAVTTTTTTETTVTDDTAKHVDVPERSITVEFTGGLEMLFSDQRRHVLSVPALDKSSRPVTVAYLIEYLCEHTMRDTRKELFVLDDHLRPGILVLINDADWELEGEEAYEIQNGDNILFVSTLHGG
ncbi:Urm1-domain-containing protein [Xylaria sp. FL0043]|nr:Urm1-domain-containing protein [Xylaria sp. FL0043]